MFRGYWPNSSAYVQSEWKQHFGQYRDYEFRITVQINWGRIEENGYGMFGIIENSSTKTRETWLIVKKEIGKFTWRRKEAQIKIVLKGKQSYWSEQTKVIIKD